MAKAATKQKKQDASPKEEGVEASGTITEVLPNLKFKVELTSPEGKPLNQSAICTLSGRMQKNNIKVLAGDKVSVELSQYDLAKGRITYRFK
jgi:translation initiation factor IF-1